MDNERGLFFMEKNKQTILFILATHGDEGFTIPIFQKIEKRYPKDKFNYDWIVGNPKAVELNSRYVDADLNRSAPGDSSSIIYEKKRAAEIIEFANNFDCVIDVHGSISDCGIITIIPKPTINNLLLAGTLPIQRNVIWYAKSSLEEGPIVQFCDPTALEIECGPKENKQVQKELEKIIIEIISGDYRISRLSEKEFYAVYGKKEADGNKYSDFVESGDSEKFYPFLANQYPGIACYKMKKIDVLREYLY